jgi:hypothetical protein
MLVAAYPMTAEQRAQHSAEMERGGIGRSGPGQAKGAAEENSEAIRSAGNAKRNPRTQGKEERHVLSPLLVDFPVTTLSFTVLGAVPQHTLALSLYSRLKD